MQPTCTAPDLESNASYERVAQLIADRFSYWQPHVFRHKASGELWASIFDDMAKWWQVTEKVEQAVEYKRKPEQAPGGPGLRSVCAVIDDKAYEEVSTTYRPDAADCVVRHKATGSLWCSTFAVRADDSDADQPGQWYEVAAVESRKVTYEAVR